MFRSYKDIFSVKLCNAHSDWLENIEWPIRALQMSVFTREILFMGLGPCFVYDPCIHLTFRRLEEKVPVQLLRQNCLKDIFR